MCAIKHKNLSTIPSQSGFLYFFLLSWWWIEDFCAREIFQLSRVTPSVSPCSEVLNRRWVMNIKKAEKKKRKKVFCFKNIKMLMEHGSWRRWWWRWRLLFDLMCSFELEEFSRRIMLGSVPNYLQLIGTQPCVGWKTEMDRNHPSSM